MNYLATSQNANKSEEMHGQYYSVEIELDGMDYPYQFRIRGIASNAICFLVKEDSNILPRLRVGDILEMKYYSTRATSHSEPRKTAIRKIIKADQGPFRGHFLVAFDILEGHPGSCAAESPLRLSEKDLSRKASELFRQGKYEEANRACTKIIEANPKNATAYFNRGVTYKKLGNNGRALKDLKVSAALGIEKARDFLHSKGILCDGMWETRRA